MLREYEEIISRFREELRAESALDPEELAARKFKAQQHAACLESRRKYYEGIKKFYQAYYLRENEIIQRGRRADEKIYGRHTKWKRSTPQDVELEIMQERWYGRTE